MDLLCTNLCESYRCYHMNCATDSERGGKMIVMFSSYPTVGNRDMTASENPGPVRVGQDQYASNVCQVASGQDDRGRCSEFNHSSIRSGSKR